MNDSKDILSLLGIPSDKICNFDYDKEGNDSIIYITLKDLRGFCPKCRSTDIGIKDYYNVNINNSIIKHQGITVLLAFN